MLSRAEIPLYLLLIGAPYGIDRQAAALQKFGRNALKYRVEKARGNARTYAEL